MKGNMTNRARGFEQEVQNLKVSASSMTMNQARVQGKRKICNQGCKETCWPTGITIMQEFVCPMRPKFVPHVR